MEQGFSQELLNSPDSYRDPNDKRSVATEVDD